MHFSIALIENFSNIAYTFNGYLRHFSHCPRL